MKEFQFIFRMYTILVMLFLLILFCTNYDRTPTISKAMTDENHVSQFIFLNTAVLSIFFFLGFCCGEGATLAHYLLIPVVVLINLLDCDNFIAVHYLLFVTYIFLVFWIIIQKHPPLYCMIFLLLPFVAFNGMGIAEIFFFILVALLL